MNQRPITIISCNFYDTISIVRVLLTVDPKIHSANCIWFCICFTKIKLHIKLLVVPFPSSFCSPQNKQCTHMCDRNYMRAHYKWRSVFNKKIIIDGEPPETINRFLCCLFCCLLWVISHSHKLIVRRIALTMNEKSARHVKRWAIIFGYSTDIDRLFVCVCLSIWVFFMQRNDSNWKRKWNETTLNKMP